MFDSADSVVMPNGMSPFLMVWVSLVDKVMPRSGNINLKAIMHSVSCLTDIGKIVL